MYRKVLLSFAVVNMACSFQFSTRAHFIFYCFYANAANNKF